MKHNLIINPNSNLPNVNKDKPTIIIGDLFSGDLEQQKIFYNNEMYDWLSSIGEVYILNPPEFVLEKHPTNVTILKGGDILYDIFSVFDYNPSNTEYEILYPNGVVVQGG